ncbi:hypothetical protein J6590_041329 [Homalodisca vitripennis]|nr:hypothetical protein J6590_041329 [Homalodisca vitripennis]
MDKMRNTADQGQETDWGWQLLTSIVSEAESSFCSLSVSQRRDVVIEVNFEYRECRLPVSLIEKFIDIARPGLQKQGYIGLLHLSCYKQTSWYAVSFEF